MAEQGFTLSSPEFQHGGVFPTGHTCDSDNTAPELNWMHPPDGTRSFALILDDPDAPDGTFTHWVLFDIPPETTRLSADHLAGIHGRNDFQQNAYGGPCPPANHGQHRYYFHLHALDVDSLKLESGAAREAVEQAMQGHIIGQTQLMARYKRSAG